MLLITYILVVEKKGSLFLLCIKPNWSQSRTVWSGWIWDWSLKFGCHGWWTSQKTWGIREVARFYETLCWFYFYLCPRTVLWNHKLTHWRDWFGYSKDNEKKRRFVKKQLQLHLSTGLCNFTCVISCNCQKNPANSNVFSSFRCKKRFREAVNLLGL